MGLIPYRDSVSIHALLAECDSGPPKCALHRRCFNPRTPCGVRLGSAIAPIPGNRFQSTHSLRSATVPRLEQIAYRKVSIHALLAECDRNRSESSRYSFLFQSTHSLRSATNAVLITPLPPIVSIHALLAECDRPCPGYFRSGAEFQSTHSLRSATSSISRLRYNAWFQSTHSLRSATRIVP